MEPQVDLLSELFDDNPEPVSVGIRFGNFIIDTIAYYVLLFIVFVFLAMSIPSETLLSVSYLSAFCTYILYYTLMEGFFGGRTLGKMITRSKAVKDDGTPLTWKNAFTRSLCRLVPFEQFSALGGHPWHDKWTNTIVIKRTNNFS
jgi:uncharacterized RDD family membrane protein YckC